MANLTRNGELAIFNVTSSGNAGLGVAVWLTARIAGLRALSGGSTLTSTAGSISLQFPYAHDDKTAFLVSWGASAEAATTGPPNLQIKAGDSWQRVLGAHNLLLDGGATGSNSTAGRLKRWIVGPFESARFAEEATSTSGGALVGNQVVTFRLTTAYVALSTRHRGKVNILPFKMPVVNYAT